MTAPSREVHPDDGALVRFLDHQVDPAEREEIENHLAGCKACVMALDGLRQASRTFTRVLARDEVRVPRDVSRAVSPRGWRGWQVAAGIVVLLAATSFLHPVRAIVASGWRSVVALWVGEPVEEVSQRTQPSSASERTGPIVAFSPRGDVLAVDIATWQRAGNLTIVVGAGANVAAQVLSGGGTEELTIAPSAGIAIQNTAASVAEYRIAVPTSVARVIVRIAGVPVEDFRPTSGTPARVVGLSGQ